MIVAENGVIENFQVIACIVSFSLFVWGAKVQFGKNNLDWAAVSLFFSLIPFVGAGRELSFGAVLSLHGTGLLYTKYFLSVVLVLMLSLSLILLVVAARRKKLHWRQALSGHVFLVFAILSIIIAQMFEKGQLGFPKNQILEELMELLAYLLLVYLSFYRLKSTR
ncbi:hypothetical protein DI396_09450 [Litorivita pollutaquae]|uniref:Uncharacterized protein n=1 Tax=Litorivita pollutaquae TaxID=2200892 RepID=A0A2V4N148_9RHOB|nr:hypothetical protein [Litorivita pollutaquae]PYC47652.1 hypothetical protein DI396_09450 [Litorivita pollutaquae]